MPSINDLLAKARIKPPNLARDIKGQARNAIKSTSNEIRNIPSSLANQAVRNVQSGVSGAVNSGLAGIRGAADKALRGDFSGALDQLTSSPADVAGRLGRTFGLSSGSTLGPQRGSGANSLEGAVSRADPMLSFNWYCELPDVTPIGGAPVALPWNYVEEATPPFRTFDVREIYSQGRNKHYPGAYSLDNLRLTFYADIANKSLTYLNAWQGAILAPFSSRDTTTGGGFGRPAGFKKPIRLYLVDNARTDIILLEYTECWPTTIEQLTLDSGSSNRLVYAVNFSVGDVFPTAFTARGGASAVNGLLASAAQSVVSNILF